MSSRVEGFNLLDPNVLAEPYDSYAALRDKAPSPDVAEVLRDTDPKLPTLLTNDPPSHARFRNLVNRIRFGVPVDPGPARAEKP